MVPGLSTTSSLSSLSTLTLRTSSKQDVEGSIPDLQHQSNARVRIDNHGETRRVTQPIKQRRRERVSEQKLRVHDKYGETRYSAFFSFEDMMRGDAAKDCEQVFNVT